MPQSHYDSIQATLVQYQDTPLLLPANMFAPSEELVMEMAVDVYRRFFTSTAFQNYVATMKRNTETEMQPEPFDDYVI